MAEATSNEMVFSYEPKNKISKEKVLKLKISSKVSNCTSKKQLWSFFLRGATHNFQEHRCEIFTQN